MCEERVLLADALVHAADYSYCVAILIGVQRSEDGLPWCLDCADARGCWAWRSMRKVSRQEIEEAKRRLRHWKSMRSSGHQPNVLIQLVERGQPAVRHV